MRLAAASLGALLTALAPAARAGLLPDSPFSDRAAGTTSAAFLRIPPGARPQSLGGAFTAAVGDSESMFWNPAGLGRLEEAGLRDLSSSYNSLLETSYASSLAYAHPLRDAKGVLGFSFLYFSQSAIQGYSSLGNPTDSFTPSDLAASLGWGKKVEAAYFGAAVKFIRSQLAGASDQTFAVDLGAQLRRVAEVGEGTLDLGAAVRNIGPGLKLGSQRDPLPLQIDGGVLWQATPRLAGQVEGHLAADSDPFVSVGVEGNLPVVKGVSAALRGGYNTRNGKNVDGLAGVCAGMGLDLVRLRFDYAWVPFGDLGQTHRISLGLRF